MAPPQPPPVPPWVRNEQDAYLYFVYRYHPSVDLAQKYMLAFAVVACASLLVTLLLHVRHCCSTSLRRFEWFMYLVPVTAAMEAVGYYYRQVTVRNESFETLVATTMLLLLPPVLLACVDYIAVGSLLEAAGKRRVLGCLRPSNIAQFFLTADIICLGVQGASVPWLTQRDLSQNLIGQQVGRGRAHAVYLEHMYIHIYMHMHMHIYGNGDENYV